MWLKINKEILQSDTDVYLCHAYIPPPSSKVLRDRDVDFFDEIEKGIEIFSRLGITYITGDFNCRTGLLSDTLDFDIYLDSYDQAIDIEPSNSPQSTLPVRRSLDHVTDMSGRRLTAMCKTTDHIIVNGRLLGDVAGNFTFSSERGMSVTDYLLVHVNDYKSIINFNVLNWNEFSDHAALYFSLQRKPNIKENYRNLPLYEEKIIFDSEKSEEYKTLLRNNVASLNILYDQNISCPEQVDALTNFLHENAKHIFSKETRIYQNNNRSNNNAKPKWFNNECYRAKYEFTKARNIFNKNKSADNRNSFIRKRTRYNNIKKKNMSRFKINEGRRLENIAKAQPRTFWKSLKNAIKSKTITITILQSKIYTSILIHY